MPRSRRDRYVKSSYIILTWGNKYFFESMAIVIRDADVKRDRNLIMDCLRRNRSRYEDNGTFRARFDWAFDHNPHGEARAWLAIDQATDKVIGYTSALSRKVFVNGKVLTGWNCADFSIDKKYRTLGAAIKLRRAAKDCVDSDEIPFFYSHPNNLMKVIHQKVGHHKIGRMVRYAALIRIDKTIESYSGNKTLARIFSPLVNPVVNLVTKKQTSSFYDFSNREERIFGDEYGRLFEKAKMSLGVVGCRDSEYLTWRFLKNPLYRMQSFRMHAGNELKGYILFFIENGVAQIGDLMIDGTMEEMRLLLGALMNYLRKTKVYSISLRIHDSNPFIMQAKSLGFRFRDDATSSVMAYIKENSPYASSLLKSENWFMTVGDRDI